MANGDGRTGVVAQIVTTVILAGLAAFMGMKAGLAKTEEAQAAMQNRVNGIELRMEKRFDRIEGILLDGRQYRGPVR